MQVAPKAAPARAAPTKLPPAAQVVLNAPNVRMAFKKDAVTGGIVYQVISHETGKVVREVPPAEIRRLSSAYVAIRRALQRPLRSRTPRRGGNR